MKQLFLLILPLIMIPLLGGCATAQDSAASGAGASQSTGKAPEESLKKGMNAAAVKAIMGDPIEVRPFPNPGGSNAEVWVYKRVADGQIQQVQIGVNSIPLASLGSGVGNNFAKDIQVPEYRQEVTTTTDTISLLLVDGIYITQKHAFTEQRHYL